MTKRPRTQIVAHDRDESSLYTIICKLIERKNYIYLIGEEAYNIGERNHMWVSYTLGLTCLLGCFLNDTPQNNKAMLILPIKQL